MNHSSQTRSFHQRIDSHAQTGASIVVIYGGELGKRYLLDGEVTLGRSAANVVMLDLDTVSRHHARIIEKNGIWVIEDLNSTNGTLVNDKEIVSATPLANGDLIKLGGAVFKFIEGGNIEALYHEEIYRMTILDGLTGMHNKRYFMEFLEREMARAKRHGRDLVLVMIDIDHFKNINDTFGHLAGDAVLQQLTRLIASVMRKDELMARYGGEEFAVLLPEAGLHNAVLFAERIRLLVEKQKFHFAGEDIQTTISLGVAAYKKDQDMEDFIRTTDEQLYRAKETGRNCVCSELTCSGNSS